MMQSYRKASEEEKSKLQNALATTTKYLETAKLANSIRYAERLPADFSALLLRDYMYLEKDFKNVLMRIPEFSHWLQSKGKMLNGVV